MQRIEAGIAHCPCNGHCRPRVVRQATGGPLLEPGFIRRVTTLFEPGFPWENGYIESLDEKLRDELPYSGLFCALKEVQILFQRRQLE